MPFTDRLHRICGFLNFEERERSNRFLRRYFIIDKNLIYYMDSPSNLPDGEPPVNEIPLHSKLTIQVVPDRPEICSCFEIRSELRTYCFQADDAHDAQEWVDHLNNHPKHNLLFQANSAPIPPPRLLAHQRNHSDGNINKENEGSYTVEIVGGIPIKIPFQSASSRKPYNSELLMGAELSLPDMTTRRSSGPPKPFILSTAPAHTNTLPCDAHLNSIKKGFCVKQGAVRKSWKRRFFVLDKSQIAYYKTDQESDPLKVVSVVDIIFAKPSPLSANLLRDNLFEIITRCRTYYVQADSPEEMNNWIDEINSCTSNRCRTPTQKHEAWARISNSLRASFRH